MKQTPTVIIAPELAGRRDFSVIREPGESDEDYRSRCEMVEMLVPGQSTPEFTLTKSAKKRGDRGVICLGEQIATVTWDWNGCRGWQIKYVHRPVWAPMNFVARAGDRRDVASFSDDTLLNGIREMLADGRLPYGEALAKVRLEIIEASNRRASAAAAARRREQQELAGPDLYAALRAIVDAMPKPDASDPAAYGRWRAAAAALARAEEIEEDPA